MFHSRRVTAIAATVAAFLAPAAAQPITADWFSTGTTTCGTGNTAVMPLYRIRGPRALCLNVPGQQHNAGSYIAYCNAAGTGGVLAMCTDAACAACTGAGMNVPFLNGQCTTVPAGVTPDMAMPRVAINCSATAGEELIVPIGGTTAMITYSAEADCSLGYRTEFRTISGACNMISDTASMSIECAGDAGVYNQFTTPDCSGAGVPTPFYYGGQCLPQPVGQPAISIQCAVAPTPTPTPSSTPSQTPSHAARSPSASPSKGAQTATNVEAQSGAASVAAGLVTAAVAVTGVLAAL